MPFGMVLPQAPAMTTLLPLSEIHKVSATG